MQVTCLGQAFRPYGFSLDATLDRAERSHDRDCKQHSSNILSQQTDVSQPDCDVQNRRKRKLAKTSNLPHPVNQHLKRRRPSFTFGPEAAKVSG